MRPDWISVIEAAHAPIHDEVAWASHLMRVAAPIFEGSRFVGYNVVHHNSDCSKVDLAISLGDGTDGVEQANLAAAVGPQAVRAFFYPPGVVTTYLEVDRRLNVTAREMMAQYRRRHGMQDAVGLVAHPLPGIAVMLYGGYGRVAKPSARQRRLLSRVALHLEAAQRPRHRPEVLRALIAPNGKVLHRETGTESIALEASAAVSRVERARTRGARSEPEAIELWSALVRGEASLVERTAGSCRQYLVLDNPPTTQPLHSMTSAERAVVSVAARGLSSKLVGYALGISQSAVSNRLRSAAAKLGVASRLELLRVAALLSRDPRAGFDDATLTAAERDVLDLLALGLSNREIASIRNRSMRTIANQVASLLRKTGSTSRRDVLGRHGAG